jgi:hypothetical protein
LEKIFDPGNGEIGLREHVLVCKSYIHNACKKHKQVEGFDHVASALPVHSRTLYRPNKTWITREKMGFRAQAATIPWIPPVLDFYLQGFPFSGVLP